MVVKSAELYRLQAMLEQSLNIKSTKIGKMALENLAVIEKEISIMQERIGSETKIIQDKYASVSEDIAIFNEKLSQNLSAMQDRDGKITDTDLFERNVEAILKGHESCRSFYTEQKEVLKNIYESEVLISGFKTVAYDELPDDLSGNDIGFIGFMTQH